MNSGSYVVYADGTRKPLQIDGKFRGLEFTSISDECARLLDDGWMHEDFTRPYSGPPTIIGVLKP